MRQRASTKTQRRLKQQQQRDPYALTGDVHCEAPTFHVGGLVTAVGVLQLVVAMVLGGYVFGGALLFCTTVLVALGLVLLHHDDPKGTKQAMGLKHAIIRLLALRRSALDYSLTLSIAQSQQYQQKKKELVEIAVVPSSPTPQRVVITMAVKAENTAKIKQKSKPNPLASNGPLATLKCVDMKPLPTIKSHSVATTADLYVEKPRANSEPKQVLQTRPLLPLKPKVQQPDIAMQGKKEMEVQEKKTLVLSKSLDKQEKTPQLQQTKTQTKPQLQRKNAEVKAPKIAARKTMQVPTVLFKAEPTAVAPVVSPKAKAVELSKPKAVEAARSSASVVVEPVAPAVAPLPVFSVAKPLVEVARGEPVLERELVITRKVLLYLSPEGESVTDMEDQELEQETKKEQTLELELEPEDFAPSMAAFPPLSPTMVPQEATPLPATVVLEPNFLMDIELEPISKPEKKLIALSPLRLKQVSNADLRSMLDELDAMQSELDAAMARCMLLSGEAESNLSKLNLEPEDELILCC
ncbi:hypothetical protein GN244_ATG08013 [Phytophthora infestans]|uniref:Uncharacterized protein n=1 Tax=Phytophthora infestans TaxID=4787 RepID=A0A833W2H6_PHYIN|nr:hypothetical protein GN244_ATG08013 [Phytophthora infestans]